SWLASVSFAQGEIPIWTNYLGAGSPYLQFYGFLFFYLVGFLNLFVGHLDWTIKFVLAGAHVASGLGMYFFVRRLCGSRRAGFVAGLGFVLCMWHMQQTLIMGRFPLSLFYALLPWPFYFVERLRFGSPLAPAVIGGGLVLGLLTFVHPGYAFWTVGALGLYIGVRVLTGRIRILRLKFAWCGLVLWLSGVVFGAYLTLPMWVERALVDLEEISHSGIPDPTWGHLFVWSNYRIQLFAFPGHDHWYGGYLGLSLVLLAGIGLYGCIKRQTRSIGLGVAICFAVSLILVVGYRWPGIRSLDLVKAFNAGRYLLFVTFFLSAMAGVGTVVVRRFFRPRVSTVMTGIVLIILTDLGATTFQHPYVLANKTFLDGPPEFYARLRQGTEDIPDDQIPNFRLSYPMDNIFYLLGIAWYTANSGIPSFLTGYREGPQA
ncbi:MAG: hypothetical protein QGG64_04335, partial [Candidatus Latescibacteria bacterium]|nr:hypothetical protein [Candidatus Latescibacterota bacterium]